MQLSEHFDSAEFLCPCGCRRAEMDPRLIAALETLRAKIGRPIMITRRRGTSIPVGGFRCTWGNAEAGGAKASQHLLGRAADVYVRGLSGDELYAIARTIPAFKGFGVAGAWLHVDVRLALMPIRWRYDRNGKQVAWPEGAKE